MEIDQNYIDLSTIYRKLMLLIHPDKSKYIIHNDDISLINNHHTKIKSLTQLSTKYR